MPASLGKPFHPGRLNRPALRVSTPLRTESTMTDLHKAPC
jgi:hypothetical protein